MSSVERAGSGCYACSVSSIEKAIIPVALETCPVWCGPAMPVKHAESPSIEKASILVVLGARSGPAMLVIHVAFPV